jgi:hypothetical protein
MALIKVPTRRCPAWAENISTIYGDAISPLEIPPTFQIEGAFGANTGGVNPLFFNVVSTAKFDCV